MISKYPTNTSDLIWIDIERKSRMSLNHPAFAFYINITIN
jgi:hypothetical protein